MMKILSSLDRTPDGRPQGPSHHILTPLAPTIGRIGPPSPCIVGAGEDVDVGMGPLWLPVRAYDHISSPYLKCISPGGCQVHNVRSMAQYLCGRGVGLTPTGDDILAGWMAVNWLLYGPSACLLEACQQFVTVAKQQTHLLSQCWLGYAAAGNVAMPIKALLDALTKKDDTRLAASTQAVLSMGATSGRDLIHGIVLGLAGYPH